MELLIEREKVNNSLKWHKVHEKQILISLVILSELLKFDHLLTSERTHSTSLIFQMVYNHRIDIALI